MSNPNLGPLVAPILWPGSGSNPYGQTSFGLFDEDTDFIDHAPKVADWVCKTLGYPVMAIELTDYMIYSQFEQAICEFSQQVNEFNMRENMIALQGLSTSQSVSQVFLKSNPLPFIIEVSRAYGSEVQTGGYVNRRKGYITMQYAVQDYDLNALWSAVSESGNRMQVHRVWHERTPAINRFFDPFAGGAGMGIGIQNLLGEFGWGSYSVASQYLLMPIYETLLRVQAIELNDLTRRSNYSFDIVNNNLRIFPVPDYNDVGIQVWFEYTIVKDQFAAQLGPPGQVGDDGKNSTISDFSNAPYSVITYSRVNDVGRRWIWKYTLAQCKLMLGRTLSKYDVIPIPNSEQRLDGLTLRQEGQQETEILIQQLRESLEKTGKEEQMRKARQNEEASAEILKRVPLLIYVA